LLRPDEVAPAAPDTDPSGQDARFAIPAPLRNHFRYRIIRRLGRGGMGSVFLAEHRLMKQLRAIKVINPALIDNPRAVERFTREIDLLSKLRHPAIVQGFDGEEAAGLYLLVMEYIEGETLDQVIERQGLLPVGLACEYARQAAEGLQYAHEQGLVHRDIKPANLMLTADGQIKILDFGLARLRSESRADTGLTQEHASIGTPDYSAPEQALDACNADICADIYSLGCTLFYLLTGRPPFGKPSAFAVSVAHLHEPPPSLRELRPARNL
jgi:serine/threonine protein kinase